MQQPPPYPPNQGYPPYTSPPPPYPGFPPPRKRSLWEHYRATSRNMQIALACGALIVVLVLGSMIGAVAGSLSGASSAATPTTGQLTSNTGVGAGATATATRAVVATATAVPATIITGPLLGGLQSDFQSAFGDPTTSAPPRFTDANAPGGFNLTVCYCESTQGTDGQLRLDNMSFTTADNSTLTAEQLRAAAQDFFPSDAKYVSDFTDPDVGVIHVYTSALLAKTFPASNFQNAGPSGPTATPGMFSVACGEPQPSHGCTITLGD